jgi:hypothetical protein
MAEAAAVAGPIIGAVGALRQGNSNASMGEYNAQIADQNAQTVVAQGAEQARRSLINSAKFMGHQEAGYAASGVSGGSAEYVMRNTAAQGELNALTLKNNAAIKATAYRNEAALDRFRGDNARTAGYFGAASGLLRGAAAYKGGGGGGSSSEDDMIEGGGEI